jgi:inward rectifier potassium channel
MAKLRAMGADIFVTLYGLDETLMQTVVARYRYSLDDIAYDAQFADLLTVHDDGTRVIDYDQFHDVEPLREPKS